MDPHNSVAYCFKTTLGKTPITSFPQTLNCSAGDFLGALDPNVSNNTVLFVVFGCDN